MANIKYKDQTTPTQHITGHGNSTSQPRLNPDIKKKNKHTKQLKGHRNSRGQPRLNSDIKKKNIPTQHTTDSRIKEF